MDFPAVQYNVSSKPMTTYCVFLFGIPYLFVLHIWYNYMNTFIDTVVSLLILETSEDNIIISTLCDMKSSIHNESHNERCFRSLWFVTCNCVSAQRILGYGMRFIYPCSSYDKTNYYIYILNSKHK